MMKKGASVTIGERQLKVQRVLAEGGFSFVYEVKQAKPAGADKGKLFAMKVVLCQSQEQLASAQREIAVHKQAGYHPNVLELVDVEVSASQATGGGAQEVRFLFPLLTLGCLVDVWDKGLRPKDDAQVLDMFAAVCRGVQCLHEDCQLRHCDIKVRRKHFCWH